MSDNYIRDALGQFADHIRSQDEVTLPKAETLVEQRLRDALTEYGAWPEQESADEVVKYATARFIELASGPFGRAQTIHYYISNGRPVPDFFRTRGFGQFSFDRNAGDYPHNYATEVGELEALALALNVGTEETIEVKIPDGVTIIDRSQGSWPREVTQEHLDADYDHNPVAPYDDEECRICGLKVTSDLRRHGSDAS